MAGKQEKIPLGPRKKRGGLRKAAIVLLLLLAAAGAVPHWIARRLPAPSGEKADAVFVLTGGENRISAGYRAWKEGKGRELYILGAGSEAKLERVLPEKEEVSQADRQRLHLEGWSENTLENAFSAKAAVASRKFRTVILVTSDYHVPRAHLAFRAVLPPAVTILVSPVRSDWSRKETWPRLARLFLVEGWKYWGYRIFLRWE